MQNFFSQGKFVRDKYTQLGGKLGYQPERYPALPSRRDCEDVQLNAPTKVV